MGRTLVIGDTHIWNHKWRGGPLVDGVNQRCRDIVDSITRTVETAKSEHGVTSVVQLGDFFDGPKPSAAVLDIAIRMIRETGIPWHIIAGNHDIASYDAPSALAPLGHVEGIHVYERPELAVVDGHSWAMVPYIGPLADSALKAAAEALSVASHAAVHYGLDYSTDSRTDIIQSTAWASMANRLNNPSIFGYFGHEHNSRLSTVYGRSLGAYTQSNFSDAQSGHPIVAIVGEESSGLDSCYCAYGPLFLDLTYLSTLDLQQLLFHSSSAAGYPLYIMVRAAHIEAAQSLLDAGAIQGYKVQTGFTASGTGSFCTVPLATSSSTPMDVVYTVTGTTASQDILEDVVAILEQDMQE